MAQRDSPTEPGPLLSDRNQPPIGLIQQLGAEGLIRPGARFRTLYGGRTNQVWRVLSGNSDAVLKLYTSALRNPLFRNDAMLEARCLTALGDTGFVPNLRGTGTFEAADWVYYDHAPGTPWQDRVETVAQLLRRLHQSRVEVDAPPGCNGSDDLDQHTQRILAACPSGEKTRLMAARPQTPVGPLAQRCLIHGDPVAGNILQAPLGLTLIDWQCPAFGDPCEDLAMFLSPAMQQLYRGAPLTDSEMRDFLVAYDRPDITERYLSLRPWYAWRMAAYCLWQIEHGAPDYARGYELEITELTTYSVG